MNLQKYEKLKDKTERMIRDADRAQGTIDQLYREMDEMFGCKTKKDARKTVQVLKDDLARDESKYDIALSRFEKEYEDARKLP